MRPGPGTGNRGGEHPRRYDGAIRGAWFAAPAAIVLWGIAGATVWQLWLSRAEVYFWFGAL